MSAFHPGFLGLYGDVDATTRTAKEFRVFFQSSRCRTAATPSIIPPAPTYDTRGACACLQAMGEARRMLHDIRLLLRNRLNGNDYSRAAFALACEHYRNARCADAENLCQQILRAAPGHRDALFLLAVLAHRGGRTAEGDTWLGKAVEAGEFSLTLEARLDPQPRWSPHAGISALLEAGLGRYDALLRSCERWLPWLETIAFDRNPGEGAVLEQRWMPD